MHIYFYFRAVVGEVDDELDQRLDLSNIKAEPLNPVVHWTVLIVLSVNKYF